MLLYSFELLDTIRLKIVYTFRKQLCSFYEKSFRHKDYLTVLYRFLITSEARTPIFSKSFIEEFSFQDHLWGGFLTAFNSFSDEIALRRT